MSISQEDQVYREILDHVLFLLGESTPVEIVAASLMAISQRLYKTHLSKGDYEKIMKVAMETPVEPYDLKKGTLH